MYLEDINKRLKKLNKRILRTQKEIQTCLDQQVVQEDKIAFVVTDQNSMKKTMEFFLENQARFDAKQQIIQETVERTTANLDRSENRLDRLEKRMEESYEQAELDRAATREAIDKVLKSTERLSEVCRVLHHNTKTMNRDIETINKYIKNNQK